MCNCATSMKSSFQSVKWQKPVSIQMMTARRKTVKTRRRMRWTQIDLVQYFLFVYLNKELIHWQNVVNCNHQRALQLTLCQAWCEHSALVFVYNKMTHYVESLLKCIQMFHLHSSTFLQKVSNGTDGSKKGVNLVFKSISLSGLTPYFGPLQPP